MSDMYDAIVIGSGPAGYECARRVVELGGKALVIEKDKLGGTCTNYGCIPTKAFHSSASFYYDVKRAENMGFSSPSPADYFKTMQDKKSKVVYFMSSGVKRILETHKVDVVNGEARIKDKNTVTVNNIEYKTKNIVIATGAKPRLLPGIQVNEYVMTSTEILELKALPNSLTIIGGGYIGSEFASIFASLGVKVTIIEALPRIVFIEDIDISNELSRLMRRQGIEIFTEAKVTKIEDNVVKFTHEKSEKTIQSDKILVAVGVVPSFNKEDLDKLGVKYGKGIDVNKRLQTNVQNIYAIGDVTDQMKLAHYAYAQAEIAARNIMGQGIDFDEVIVPSAIFTVPEISSVGVRNKNLKSAKFNFAASGKARAMSEPDGFVKVFYENGYLKGFCAIGAHASDLVAEAALAIKNNIPLEKIKETIHVHPTLSEAFSGAVDIALRNP